MKIMNKLILFFIMFLLFINPALSFEQSTQNPMPYILDGIIHYQYDDVDDVLEGVIVKITNERTGFSTNIETNSKGYFIQDLRGMLVQNSWEMPYQFNDIVSVKFCNENNPNCIRKVQLGSREICKKNIGIDCSLYAPAQGGFRVDFNAKAADIIHVYQEEKEIEITAESWWSKWKQQDPQMILLEALLFLVLTILAAQYKWGKSFYYLVKYWIQKGDYQRAVKMMKTALEKDKAGAYKK